MLGKKFFHYDKISKLLLRSLYKCHQRPDLLKLARTYLTFTRHIPWSSMLCERRISSETNHVYGDRLFLQMGKMCTLFEYGHTLASLDAAHLPVPV